MRDNHFTELCFLPNINMNHPQVYLWGRGHMDWKSFWKVLLYWLAGECIKVHNDGIWWNMFICVCIDKLVYTHTCSLLGLPYNNRLIWLKTTEFYFLTVLEVWFLLRPLPLAWRWLPSCCILTLPFFCAQASLVSLRLPKCYLLMRIPIMLE